MNTVFEIIDIPDLPDIMLPEKIDVTNPCKNREVEYRINDIPVKPGDGYGEYRLEGIKENDVYVALRLVFIDL